MSLVSAVSCKIHIILHFYFDAKNRRVRFYAKLIKSIFKQKAKKAWEVHVIVHFNPTRGRGGQISPPGRKIAFLVHFSDPIDPKKFDFSQIAMTMPPILFRGLKMA